MQPKHDGGQLPASHTAADGSPPGHDMPTAQQSMDMGHHSMGGEHPSMKQKGSDTGHQSAAMDHGGMAGMAHGHSGGMMDMTGLKRRFFISLALAVPILLLSPMMGLSLPFQITFPGQEWLVLALGSILYFYGGAPFLRGAAGELKAKSPAMMTLIALGITTAYVYSIYATLVNRFGHGAHVMDFFWELATLIVIMLLGHWIEMRAVQSAGDALQSMAKLLPAEAAQLQADGSVRTVPLAEVKTGAQLLVKPGAKMPADGVILAGESNIDESLITGEAAGVAKKAGDTVIGGSQNGNGSLTIRMSATGESGYLAQVMQLVKGAQQEKSHAESLADKVAKWLFYVRAGAGHSAGDCPLHLSGRQKRLAGAPPPGAGRRPQAGHRAAG